MRGLLSSSFSTDAFRDGVEKSSEASDGDVSGLAPAEWSCAGNVTTSKLLMGSS
ncbi:MAG: hypothetical protein ACT4O9_01420 [Blastocatellia bacterium]